MVFYAAFNSISVISRQQLTLFMSFLGFTSTRLGSEVSCPKTIQRKNPDDPVPLDYESNTLPLSHPGPLNYYEEQCRDCFCKPSSAIFNVYNKAP